MRREEEACFRWQYEVLTLGRPFGAPVHIIDDDVPFAMQFSSMAGAVHSGALSISGPS